MERSDRYVNYKICVSKQKLSYLEKKKVAPCFFESIKRSYPNHASNIKGNDLL